MEEILYRILYVIIPIPFEAAIVYGFYKLAIWLLHKLEYKEKP